MEQNLSSKTNNQRRGLVKFLFFSFLGIFMFFVSVSINGKKTIPLDHLVTFIKTYLSPAIPFYILGITSFGAIKPFAKGTWKSSRTQVFFSFAKVAGAILTYMVYFKIGPEWLFAKDMGPFLYNVLLVSVGVIVPIGAIFLTFLIGYGFLEFFGVIMKPVMRPIFKTPGKSSLDAVASFVGSYSVGLLITNRVFKEGKYSIKEATIIATGFSTVSATFMIVIAKTLGLMEIWNLYFWSTLIITFIVTAITVRIYPIRSIPETYYKGDGYPEKVYEGNLFKNAINEGIDAANNAQPLFKNIYENFKDGLLMAANILPTGMSLALVGLILSKYTNFFDYLGYIYLPFFKVLNIPDAILASKAAALSIAECFIPSLVVTASPLLTKYVVGVICVSAIVFFAATVPCILGTEIPVKIKDLVVIWIERVMATIVLASIVGKIFL